MVAVFRDHLLFTLAWKFCLRKELFIISVPLTKARNRYQIPMQSWIGNALHYIPEPCTDADRL